MQHDYRIFLHNGGGVRAVGHLAVRRYGYASMGRGVLKHFGSGRRWRLGYGVLGAVGVAVGRYRRNAADLAYWLHGEVCPLACGLGSDYGRLVMRWGFSVSASARVARVSDRGGPPRFRPFIVGFHLQDSGGFYGQA